MQIDEMNRDEINLLLYFETCCVDQTCRVEGQRMNAEDFALAKKWCKEGFITFGRLRDYYSHYCTLSDAAWTVVAEARKARGKRSEARLNRVLEGDWKEAELDIVAALLKKRASEEEAMKNG